MEMLQSFKEGKIVGRELAHPSPIYIARIASAKDRKEICEKGGFVGWSFRPSDTRNPLWTAAQQHERNFRKRDFRRGEC